MSALLDIIAEMEVKLAKQQEEIAEYRDKLKSIADETVINFNYKTAKPIYDLLAKHNKGE